MTSRPRRLSTQASETVLPEGQKSAGKTCALHEAFIQAGIYLRNWSPRTVRTYRQGLAALAIERPVKVELDA
jgi:hypothetical protein